MKENEQRTGVTLRDGLTVYELVESRDRRGKPYLHNRWSATIQGAFGPDTATPEELESLARLFAVAGAMRDALIVERKNIAHHRACQTELSGAECDCGVAERIASIDAALSPAAAPAKENETK